MLGWSFTPIKDAEPTSGIATLPEGLRIPLVHLWTTCTGAELVLAAMRRSDFIAMIEIHPTWSLVRFRMEGHGKLRSDWIKADEAPEAIMRAAHAALGSGPAPEIPGSAALNVGIRKSVDIEHAINVLNAAVRDDSRAMTQLIAHRIPCNDALANHPTIQCGGYGDTPVVVGFLGVLNGIFGIDSDGYGGITATLNDDDTIREFVKTRDGGSMPAPGSEGARP